MQMDERLQWLKYVLNPALPLPVIQDWKGLYEFTQKQAIAGVCTPTQFKDVRPDIGILYEWIGLCRLLSDMNIHLNSQVVKVVAKLKEAGFRCCILKGQGNASMYPFPNLRTPGDIDVWVDADKKALYAYVKSQFPEAKTSFKHIKFPIFEKDGVDIHYTPLKFYHPGHNKRLQRWIEANKEQQMSHHVRLDGTDNDISIPTAEFNAVYQMGHILIHVEDEGIGLRQIVDYYYVLKALQELDEGSKDGIRQTWESLGMSKFAAAVMWVEHNLLGLSEEFLLIAPNEKMGKLLADDIMEGGNFGRYSNRQKLMRFGNLVKKLANVWRLIRWSVCFPREAFFKLLSKIRTFCMVSHHFSVRSYKI